MMMNRRALLRTTMLVLPAVALADCANAPLTPAEIVAQAGAAASGLDGMLTQVVAKYPNLIPAATVTDLHDDLTKAEQAAVMLSGSLPAPSGASIVQTVEGYLNSVLSTLAAPPINGLIPAPFNEVVAAAALVIPGLEAFVNQYIPTSASASPATLAVRAKLRAGAPQIATMDQALAALQRYSKH